MQSFQMSVSCLLKLGEFKVTERAVVGLNTVSGIGDALTLCCRREEFTTELHLLLPLTSFTKPERAHPHHLISTGSQHGHHGNVLVLTVQYQLGGYGPGPGIEYAGNKTIQDVLAVGFVFTDNFS